MDVPTRVWVIVNHPPLRNGIHRPFSARRDLVVVGAARGLDRGVAPFPRLRPTSRWWATRSPGSRARPSWLNCT